MNIGDNLKDAVMCIAVCAAIVSGLAGFRGCAQHLNDNTKAMTAERAKVDVIVAEKEREKAQAERFRLEIIANAQREHVPAESR